MFIRSALHNSICFEDNAITTIFQFVIIYVTWEEEALLSVLGGGELSVQTLLNLDLLN
jgi:hypothetical protein